MIQNFRTYDLAVKFYKKLPIEKVPTPLRDQLSRAASSIVLNLAEGSGKSTSKDQKRFFSIAFGSTREVQAIFDLVEFDEKLADELDHIAASIWKLVYK